MSDVEHDDRLRLALRHAPDAQAQPPAALSEAILREARAKARDRQPAREPTPAWALRAWQWLARPAVATGLAGVMAATLVGLMWWDEPMDAALPRRPEPVATPGARPAAEASSGTPVTVAPPPADVPRNRAAEPRQSVPTSVERPAAETLAKPPAAPSRKAAPAERQSATTSPGREIAAAASPPPERTTAPDRSAAGMAQENVAPAAAPNAAPPAPSTAPPAAPSTAPAAPAAAQVAAARPAPPAAPLADAITAEHAARARQEDQLLHRQADAATASRRASAKAELAELRSRREAEAYQRLAALRSVIATEPSRWSWRRGGESAQAMNDAVYAWLAELDSTAGTAWPRLAARDESAPLGAPLQLLQDGAVRHTLQLTERGVVWQQGQQTHAVALPLEALARLRTALDQATPR